MVYILQKDINFLAYFPRTRRRNNASPRITGKKIFGWFEEGRRQEATGKIKVMKFLHSLHYWLSPAEQPLQTLAISEDAIIFPAALAARPARDIEIDLPAAMKSIYAF